MEQTDRDVMRLIQLIILPLIFASCATINKVGIRATGGILTKAGNEFTKESDFGFFEKSVPGNLKFMEGLWYSDQSNNTLLSNLIKGFGGYGFAVHETYHLRDHLADKRGEAYRNALTAYSKAMDYGIAYLADNGIKWQDMITVGASEKVQKWFDDELGDDDMIAVFYLAQSWGSLINLQRDNIELVSHIGTVKSMMDWVCQRDPEFELGSCHIFYAAYEAGRPVMLGGDPEKGAELFRNFIKKYPHNLLGRIAYIQFYVIPMMDEDIYADEKKVLTKELALWEQQKNYGSDLSANSKYRSYSKYNLYNAIAKERFEIIKKFEKEIF